jgi:hypothetical protein
LDAVKAYNAEKKTNDETVAANSTHNKGFTAGDAKVYKAKVSDCETANKGSKV